jgi:hypothetical protein
VDDTAGRSRVPSVAAWSALEAKGGYSKEGENRSGGHGGGERGKARRREGRCLPCGRYNPPPLKQTRERRRPMDAGSPKTSLGTVWSRVHVGGCGDPAANGGKCSHMVQSAERWLDRLSTEATGSAASHRKPGVKMASGHHSGNGDQKGATRGGDA